MNLPDKEKIFLALKIEKDEVKSAFWKKENKEVIVLALGSNEGWEETKEELMVACDASVAVAVSKCSFNSGEEPHSVIFGLPEGWIEENKVIKEKLEDLRFITKKLSLSPLGFVSVSEAVLCYLKKVDKEFSSAILVYVSNKELTISLIKDGQIKRTEYVGRSDNLALDIEEGILRFSPILDLPSRIILYNSDDLEEARQSLISYPWQPPSESEGKPGFLHLPRVEILPADFDIRALAFAGGIDVQEEQIETEIEEEKPETGETEELKEPAEAEEIVDSSQSLVIKAAEKTNGIEFVKDKDILEEVEFLEEKEEKIEEEIENTLPAEREIKEKVAILEIPQKKSLPSLKNLIFFFPKIISFPFKFLRIKERFRNISFGKRFSFLKWFLAGGGLLLLLFILGFYLFARADITLTFVPKTVDQEFEFQIDSQKKEIDWEKKIIPFHFTSATVSNDKNLQTSGKKVIGERAKGEITIYNRTESTKIFSSGTALIGPGKLKFTLDNEVKIASKSPDISSGLDRWGEAKVNITAAEIGVQYNIEADNQFYFENLSSSSFLAKNPVAFLGGTSRQISVVSQSDQDKLVDELNNELKNKLIEKLEGSISKDEILLLATTELKVKSEKFDHEVGDETTLLSLNLELEGKAAVLKTSDLLDLAEKSLLPESISGMELEKDKSEITVAPVSEEEKSKFLARVKLVLKPKIDQANLIEKIRGKSIVFAQNLLLEQNSIKFIEIKISPGFFRSVSFMPFNKKKIFLNLKTN